MSDVVLEVVLPPVNEDELSERLVALTKTIDEADPERVAHGFLGGTHGYGGHWDSPVFQMRPFCWCESADCPWCMGCDCPASASHYYVDGVEVSFDEWMAFFDRETAPFIDDHEAWMKAAEAANARRPTKDDAVCAYCRGERFREKGAEPGKGAPNFWHKPSGLKVWWYKYIGRGQELSGPPSADLRAIFAECAQDVRDAR